jgi:hypothetical protein
MLCKELGPMAAALDAQRLRLGTLLFRQRRWVGLSRVSSRCAVYRQSWRLHRCLGWWRHLSFDKIDSHYRSIRPCYIHVVMDGQGSPWDLNELEWVLIR